MAISWGNWVGTSPRRHRIGIEYTSIPTPAYNSTAVTVTAKIWVGVEYSFNDDNNTFAYSGTLGSGGWANGTNITVASNSSKLLATLSKSIAVSGSATPLSITASLTGIDYVGASLKSQHTATNAIPAKPAAPVSAPGAPAWLTCARVDDSSTTLTWPAVSGATSYIIARYDFSKPSDGYVTWGYPTGTSTTVSSQTVNNAYDWRIAAVNSGGQSGWTYPNDSYSTTPTAPANLTATKSGNDIVVTIGTDWSPHNDQWEWRESSNGGSTWTVLGTTPNAQTSYTHVAPSAATSHVYQARANITSQGLNSAWSASSNVVQLSTPPAPPTPVAPLGTTINRTLNSVTFSWLHNAVDTTGQTAANVRYRPVGSGTWVTVNVANADQFLVRAITFLAGEAQYEWQVQTKGANAAYGDWSALTTFNLGTPPTVSITGPTNPVRASRPLVTWTFNDVDSGDAQVWAEVTLRDASQAVLSTQRSNGDATSLTLGYTLVDNVNYFIDVTVQDGAGLTATAQVARLADFLAPPNPSVEATYDNDDHAVYLVHHHNLGTDLITNPSFETSAGASAEIWKNWHTNPYPSSTTGTAGSANTTRTYGGGAVRWTQNASTSGNVEVGVGAGAGAGLPTTGIYTLLMKVRASKAMAAYPRISGVQGAIVPLTTEWQAIKVQLTVATSPGVLGTGLLIPDASISPGDWVEVSNILLVSGAYNGEWFSGASSPSSDFTPSWTGTANASTSILSAVGVSGATASAAQIVYANEWSVTGERSLRLISKTPTVGAAYAQLGGYTLTQGQTYTFVITGRLTQDATYSPYVKFTQLVGGDTITYLPTQAGVYEVRFTVTLNAGSTSYSLRLHSGGPQGSPDVWWDNVAVVAGTFDGAWGGLQHAGDEGTAAVRYERSLDGRVWAPLSGAIATGPGLDSNYTDRTHPLNTMVHYRVISISSEGAESPGSQLSVFTESLDGAINYGPDKTTSFSLHCGLQLPASMNDNATSHRLSGRPMPVNVYDLDHPANIVLSAQGVVKRHTPIMEIERAFREITRQDVLWRDHHSRVFTAKISGMKLTPNVHGFHAVAFTVTESDGGDS